MDTNLCTFCENAEETIYHLLWECPKVQHLLAKFVRVCKSQGTKIDQLTVNALIYNIKELYKVIKFCAKKRSEMDMINTDWRILDPCD